MTPFIPAAQRARQQMNELLENLEKTSLVIEETRRDLAERKQREEEAVRQREDAREKDNRS